ncbi:hypothetical protein PSEUDO8AS_50196 [Pseudomonas sp. 8AS]|nr:hypothetical protein PSEUDO8AS_50196 [Pseudomonas sp. 8AS]
MEQSCAGYSTVAPTVALKAGLTSSNLVKGIFTFRGISRGISYKKVVQFPTSRAARA